VVELSQLALDLFETKTGPDPRTVELGPSGLRASREDGVACSHCDDAPQMRWWGGALRCPLCGIAGGRP